MKRLPTTGVDRATLFEQLEAKRAGDVDWRQGRTFGYVYDAGREAMAICKEAYGRYLTENALDPTVYPSLLQMENDIVAIALSHLRAPEGAVGSFTSGGTESVILAVKTARDLARATRPRVGRPQIVLPITGHACAHKAAHLLGLEVVEIDVDHDTFKARPEAYREAITDDTVLLFASAPSYAHGVVDPVAEIGEVALEHDLPLHVDACIGGWLLPFVRELGEPITAFDFSVPGVTSISMDLHKYAYAAKGASTVLYRDKSFRRHQVYSCARWTGYTVINNTVQSSRSGGPIAGAWAVLHHLGADGYLRLARDIHAATHRLAEGVEAIEGLELMAPPEMSLFAFTSSVANVFHIVDEMKVRGWYIQPQLAYGCSPENIHLSVNPNNVGLVEPFLADLRVAVEAAKELPSGQLVPFAEQLAAMGVEMLASADIGAMMSMVGVHDGAVPGRMAGINEFLNALPAEVSEVLLSGFFNEMFKPSP